jgi:hypothetical protein
MALISCPDADDLLARPLLPLAMVFGLEGAQNEAQLLDLRQPFFILHPFDQAAWTGSPPRIASSSAMSN